MDDSSDSNFDIDWEDQLVYIKIQGGVGLCKNIDKRLLRRMPNI